jgi:hypothetical protein
VTRKLRSPLARAELGNGPPPIFNNPLFTDLFKSWNLVAHNYVTGPRRELARKRGLSKDELGDIMIIEEDGVRTAVSQVDQIFISDRGLQELLIDESLDTADLDDELVDKVYVYFDRYDEGTNANIRTIEIFDMTTRLERSFVIDHVRMVGFDFLSDRLSTDAYWRIAKNTGRYRDESSTNESVKFLSWMINSDFQSESLWSPNGINFQRKQAIKYTRADGFYVYVGQVQYFPTSHVVLKYDAEKSPFINIEKMQEFFLRQAPINVVLRGVIAQLAPLEAFPSTVIGSFTRIKYSATAR